jgi:uncharacterized DUF497 family protein
LVRFEWDPRKAANNVKRHHVSFEEASSIFGDPLSLTVADSDHSEYEDRFATLGRSSLGRLLVVVHNERGETVRIITARLATRRERISYEEESI